MPTVWLRKWKLFSSFQIEEIWEKHRKIMGTPFGTCFGKYFLGNMVNSLPFHSFTDPTKGTAEIVVIVEFFICWIGCIHWFEMWVSMVRWIVQLNRLLFGSENELFIEKWFDGNCFEKDFLGKMFWNYCKVSTRRAAKEIDNWLVFISLKILLTSCWMKYWNLH